MIYVCQYCGHEFDEPKLFQEYMGEHFGFPAYEKVYGCPLCGSNYEEKTDYAEETFDG